MRPASSCRAVQVALLIRRRDVDDSGAVTVAAEVIERLFDPTTLGRGTGRGVRLEVEDKSAVLVAIYVTVPDAPLRPTVYASILSYDDAGRRTSVAAS